MISINEEESVRDVVVIGASAGGIAALIKLLSQLPSTLPAVVGVVVHRGDHSQANWSRTLGRDAALKVVEPSHGQPLENGVVYVAPADRHMIFRGGCALLDHSPRVHFTRPAIDPLFSSAAQAYGSRVVGVVLTGSGKDGTRGLIDISGVHGLALVQAPEEAQFAAMPENALARDHVRAALTIDQLAHFLPRIARGEHIEVASFSPRDDAR